MVLMRNELTGYEVWGKSEFINYIFSRRAIQKKTIDNTWNKISKGYNFVIAIYKEDIKDYDIFSIEKVNELFGVGKDIQESTIIKETEIKIIEVIPRENRIRRDTEIVELILKGIKVCFKYKCMEVETFIETNKLLTIKEIKQEIIRKCLGKQHNVKEDM